MRSEESREFTSMREGEYQKAAYEAAPHLRPYATDPEKPKRRRRQDDEDYELRD